MFNYKLYTNHCLVFLKYTPIHHDTLIRNILFYCNIQSNIYLKIILKKHKHELDGSVLFLLSVMVTSTLLLMFDGRRAYFNFFYVLQFYVSELVSWIRENLTNISAIPPLYILLIVEINQF